MKRLKVRTIYTSIVVLCIGITWNAFAIVFAGAGSSGGGDRYKEDFEAAWFIGNKRIDYCIEIANDFPINKERTESTIQKVISQWKNYTSQKKDQKEVKIKLNFNYKFVEQCLPTTALTFYFGINSPRVKKAKSHFSNPIAFALKESYNFSSGIGKGLIWIKTDPKTNNKVITNDNQWEKNDSFYGILLHEFGHVLGVPHVAGTIMDENISKWLFIKSNIFNNKKIDHVVELAQKESNEMEFIGIPDMSTKRSKEIFKFLSGRNSVGKIESVFAFNLGSNKMNIGHIILKDQLGSYSFELTFDIDSWSTTYANTKVFKKAYLSSINQQKTTTYNQHHSFTNFGKLKTKHGVSFTMIMEYNFLKHPRESDILDDDGNVFDNPDLNNDLGYANIPYEIYILKNQKKTRIFGPSAYWTWWYSSSQSTSTIIVVQP